MGKLSRAPDTLGTAPRSLRPAPKVADAFYQSRAWRRTSGLILKIRGRRCERCSTTQGRMIVDHIVERKDGGADFAHGNLMVLCHGCHNAKTARVAKARR